MAIQTVDGHAHHADGGEIAASQRHACRVDVQAGYCSVAPDTAGHEDQGIAIANADDQDVSGTQARRETIVEAGHACGQAALRDHTAARHASFETLERATGKPSA